MWCTTHSTRESVFSADKPEEGPPALACFIIAALCPLSRRWLFMEQTAQGSMLYVHVHVSQTSCMLPVVMVPSANLCAVQYDMYIQCTCTCTSTHPPFVHKCALIYIMYALTCTLTMIRVLL